MSPEHLLGELDHILDLPTTSQQDALLHQQTLRATIGGSYRLLDEEARVLFARLGVFVGGFTLEAAAAVCGGKETERSATVAGVTSLEQKSLLETSPDSPGGSRLVCLEAMREYAVERLEERGEAEELGRRHAEYYVDIAETAEVHLTGKEQVRWLTVIDEEHANLWAALRWSTPTCPAGPAAGRGAVAVLDVAGPLHRGAILARPRRWPAGEKDDPGRARAATAEACWSEARATRPSPGAVEGGRRSRRRTGRRRGSGHGPRELGDRGGKPRTLR